jgi:YjbR
MKIDSVRKYAMALEAVTEEPHHNYSSFRVRGKIFVTIPPGEELIHVFVGEQDREPALAMYPEFIEKLLWGAKVVGLRVSLTAASPAVVKSLVSKAYETRVQKDAGPKFSKPKNRAPKS